MKQINHGPVKAGQTDYWNNEALTIPPLPPSKLVHCKIINITYAVRVCIGLCLSYLKFNEECIIKFSIKSFVFAWLLVVEAF